MENAYTKLKSDFEHLQGRTWQLFECGYNREAKLKAAVVQAWKHFERIAESDDLDFIKADATMLRDHLNKILKENSK